LCTPKLKTYYKAFSFLTLSPDQSNVAVVVAAAVNTMMTTTTMMSLAKS
jgi:hypothetical protein